MKLLLLAAGCGCLICLVGCETTGNGAGSQETKHRAAIEQQKQQPAVDEAEANLWNAHEDMVNRDSNPIRAY
jgi:hypothetical protein